MNLDTSTVVLLGVLGVIGAVFSTAARRETERQRVRRARIRLEANARGEAIAEPEH